MTELEHLTKLIESAMYWGADTPEKIAERLIDESVICPPCKVGDTVYEVDTISNRVNRFVINDLYHLGRLIDDECFGTLVFLAREEAEAALAERRKA